MDPNELNLALTFLEKFVLGAFYTRTETSVWIERNKGKSLFNLITTVSIAYSRMISESNELLWEEQSKVSTAERKMYDHKLQKKV